MSKSLTIFTLVIDSSKMEKANDRHTGDRSVNWRDLVQSGSEDGSLKPTETKTTRDRMFDREKKT